MPKHLFEFPQVNAPAFISYGTLYLHGGMNSSVLSMYGNVY